MNGNGKEGSRRGTCEKQHQPRADKPMWEGEWTREGEIGGTMREVDYKEHPRRGASKQDLRYLTSDGWR